MAGKSKKEIDPAMRMIMEAVARQSDTDCETLGKLATLSGVTLTHLREIAHEQHIPRGWINLYRLAKASGMTMEEIVEGIGWAHLDDSLKVS
jgi:hypothetical protein